MQTKYDLPISNRIKQVWAPWVPIEVRFGLVKVEITWVESTLYDLKHECSGSTGWGTDFGLVARSPPGQKNQHARNRRGILSQGGTTIN